MSSPTSRWIDRRVDEALSRAFEEINKYLLDGYCTEEDVLEALIKGWGEGVAEGWREWINEVEAWG